MKTKQEFRKYCITIWKNFLKEKKYDLLENFQSFIKNSSFDFQKIFCFYPTKEEPPLMEILEKQYKMIFLPVIEDYKNCVMNFYLYKNGNYYTKLYQNPYGIWEPEKVFMDYPKNSVVIIPSLGANKDFARLGRGKGYYDRYFSKNSFECIKVTLLPEELTELEFFREEQDLVLDSIITEKNIYNKKI